MSQLLKRLDRNVISLDGYAKLVFYTSFRLKSRCITIMQCIQIAEGVSSSRLGFSRLGSNYSTHKEKPLRRIVIVVTCFLKLRRYIVKSIKYCSFINSLIHFDHQMYIEGRIVIPTNTTSSSICPT